MILILNFTWLEKVSLIPSSEKIHVTCTKYWWRNILYINNFFSWNEQVRVLLNILFLFYYVFQCEQYLKKDSFNNKFQCLSWSWYMPNDMHFFIFGSIILTLMKT